MKKKYLISISLFSLCLLTSLIGNLIILNLFPQRVVSDDLLFKVIPYSLSLEFASDILFFSGLFSFAYLFIFKIKARRADILNIIFIFFIARSILMIFTPLMRPTGIDFPSHGIFREFITQLGMFPSGHIGLLALFYFLIDRNQFKNIKNLFLINLILSAILMVVSLGHYTIDVIGGIMLAYIIVSEYQKRFFKKSKTSV